MHPHPLAEGMKVVLVDRAQDRLEQLSKEPGANALPLVADLSKPSEVSGMLPRILEDASGPVAEGDPDAWDRMLNLNIKAASARFTRFCPHD